MATRGEKTLSDLEVICGLGLARPWLVGEDCCKFERSKRKKKGDIEELKSCKRRAGRKGTSYGAHGVVRSLGSGALSVRPSLHHHHHHFQVFPAYTISLQPVFTRRQPDGG